MEDYEQEVEQEEKPCSVTILLGPCTVLAEPFVYDLDDGEGAMDLLCTKDGSALKLRLDRGSLTVLPVQGDVLVAMVIAHDQICPDSLGGNCYEATELYQIKNGQVSSLYYYCKIKPAKEV